MSTTQPLIPDAEIPGFAVPVSERLVHKERGTGAASVPVEVSLAEGQGRGAAPELLLPPKPKSARYASLDLWRGLACLMLLLYHATFYADLQFRLGNMATWSWSGVPITLLRHCWAGVPIFFVISGYCIAASVDSLRRRPHSIRDYFVRRFRRIYPPLWIMCLLAVGFTAIVSTVPVIKESCLQLPKIEEFSFGQWVGNFIAIESWRHNISGGQPAYLMANTWTLCYEEQFYFITGLVLAFASRRFFSVVAWLTVAVLVARHTLPLLGIPLEGFFWDGHWLMFAAGILVYHGLNYVGRGPRWWYLGILLAGMLYGAVERIQARDSSQKHMGEYIFVACAFAIALVFLRRWDDRVAQHWSMAPLRWCGQRSYSIYLTHYLLVVVLSSLFATAGWKSELAVATVVVPVCLVASLPFAVLFHATVERRFLNAPLDVKTPRPNRAGGVATV